MNIDTDQDGLAHQQRFAAARAAASHAFCRTLAQHYPEATPDHRPPFPDEAIARPFADAMHTAAQAWLTHARPIEGFAPTRPAGEQLARARTAAAAQRIAEHIASCGLNTNQLYDITAQAIHDNVDDLLADGDFAPISDDAARYALRNEADYRLSEAADAGIIGLAHLLCEVLGERAAITTISANN